MIAIPLSSLYPLPVSIIDKPLSKGTKKVSLSAFSYIFSELVQYHQSRSDHIQQLESKYVEYGMHVCTCVRMCTYGIVHVCTREGTK